MGCGFPVGEVSLGRKGGTHRKNTEKGVRPLLHVSGGIAGGSIDSAWRGAKGGALSGGLFTAANNISSDWNAYGRIAAKATAGGLSNDLQGRNFADGFHYNFLYYSSQELTDHLARMSGLQATDPNSGKLDTVGTRASSPEFPVKDASIFGKLGLQMGAEGEWRGWYQFPAVRTFVVDVSKVHDAMDVWMYRGGYYAPTGNVFLDSLNDVYSVAGMLPAAAFTAAGPRHGSPVGGQVY